MVLFRADLSDKLLDDLQSLLPNRRRLVPCCLEDEIYKIELVYLIGRVELRDFILGNGLNDDLSDHFLRIENPLLNDVLRKMAERLLDHPQAFLSHIIILNVQSWLRSQLLADLTEVMVLGE